jgi:O-antigen/teichoic acid export membrane protein
LISTAISTGLLVALVPLMGLVGAALAAAAGIVFTNATIMILVRRRLGLFWRDRRYWAWIGQGAAAAGLGLVAFLSPLHLGPVTLAAVLAGMYLAAAAANLMQGLNADDRELLQDLWRRASRGIARP